MWKMKLSVSFASAFILFISFVVNGGATEDVVRLEKMSAHVLVPPTGRHLPFFVERNGKPLQCIDMRTDRTLRLQPGDRIACCCYIKPQDPAALTHIDEIQLEPRHSTPQDARTFSGEEFYNLPKTNAFVAIQGVVHDVCRDDIDENFGFAFIDCQGKIVEASFGISDGGFNEMASLVGTEVVLTGVIHGAPHTSGTPQGRRIPKRTLHTGGAVNCRVIKPAPITPTAAIDFSSALDMTPEEISRLPSVRLRGTVLAAWSDGNILVACGSGNVSRVELATKPAPRPGQAIEVLGRPETDLFDINLVRARWRPCPAPPRPEPPAADCTIRSLFESYRGEFAIDTGRRGSVLTVRGEVKSIASGEDGGRQLLIGDSGYMIKVDCSAAPEALSGIAEGFRVKVTGVCVLSSDHWRPHVVFPKVRGLFLVTRRPSDVTVISRPPWWTPKRLLIAGGILLLLLIGIFIWNVTLRRRARRLAHIIARGEIAQKASELKVGERTRLAVELHDGVVQNLTGVAMGIRSALLSRTEAPEQLDGHLRLTLLTLDSCRDELRNCIWELHNLTLDETTIDEAIRKALLRHLGDTRLKVRFNVPRERLADNILYALIRIIRELTINSVQHGHATEVKVAGTIEKDRLLFSVQDDGIGFDPATAPGIEQGHFGLQGISDRIEGLDGELTIESAPGKGVKAKIELPLSTLEEHPTP